jgi:hypothetical protein
VSGNITWAGFAQILGEADSVTLKVKVSYKAAHRGYNRVVFVMEDGHWLQTDVPAAQIKRREATIVVRKGATPGQFPFVIPGETQGEKRDWAKAKKIVTTQAPPLKDLVVRKGDLSSENAGGLHELYTGHNREAEFADWDCWNDLPVTQVG